MLAAIVVTTIGATETESPFQVGDRIPPTPSGFRLVSGVCLPGPAGPCGLSLVVFRSEQADWLVLGDFDHHRDDRVAVFSVADARQLDRRGYELGGCRENDRLDPSIAAVIDTSSSSGPWVLAVGRAYRVDFELAKVSCNIENPTP